MVIYRVKPPLNNSFVNAIFANIYIYIRGIIINNKNSSKFITRCR